MLLRQLKIEADGDAVDVGINIVPDGKIQVPWREADVLFVSKIDMQIFDRHADPVMKFDFEAAANSKTVMPFTCAK